MRLVLAEWLIVFPLVVELSFSVDNVLSEGNYRSCWCINNFLLSYVFEDQLAPNKELLS